MYFSFPTAVAQSIELIVIRSIRLSRKGQDDIPSRHHTHTHTPGWCPTTSWQTRSRRDDVPSCQCTHTPGGCLSVWWQTRSRGDDVPSRHGTLTHRDNVPFCHNRHMPGWHPIPSSETHPHWNDVSSRHDRRTHTGITSHRIMTHTHRDVTSRHSRLAHGMMTIYCVIADSPMPGWHAIASWQTRPHWDDV